MPELPEVETTLRFIRPRIMNESVTNVIIRQPSLRYKVRDDLPGILKSKKVLNVSRRAKYILLNFTHGNLIMHLGMSGSIKIADTNHPLHKHDHVDIVFTNLIMRYNDPRRFGCIVWEGEKQEKSLLNNLGVEPLTKIFNGELLYRLTRGRSTSIKQFIMDSKFIVGVGNIYASESLWEAKIDPTKPAKECSINQCAYLSDAIKQILNKAIKAGGSTIRDFKGADGKPGYFALQLNVYGKEKESCPACGSAIKRIVQGQRASFYCDTCQT